MILRAAILVPRYFFFLYYARKDYPFRRRQRAVPWAEFVLHGAIDT